MKRKNKIRTLVRSKIYESIITKRMNASRLNEGDVRPYEADEFSWGECDISELDSDFLGFFTMWFEDRGKAESETREWLDPAFFKSLAGIAIYFTSFSLPPMGTVCDTLVNLSKIFTRGKQNVEMALNKNAGLDTSREREQQNRDKLSAKELKDQERAEKLRAKEAEGTLTAEQKAELKQLKADKKAGVRNVKQRKKQLQSMRYSLSSNASDKFKDQLKKGHDEKYNGLDDFETVILRLCFLNYDKSYHDKRRTLNFIRKWKREQPETITYTRIVNKLDDGDFPYLFPGRADLTRFVEMIKRGQLKSKFEDNPEDFLDILYTVIEKLQKMVKAR